jgi:tripartite-type tricarboxylate transporter receptor subunit TctC
MSELRETSGAPSRRAIIKAALAAGVAAPAILRVGAALAAYPERPVRIVVANTPGGPSDIIARFMAAALQEAMGGSFVVENKGGGGGNIGMGSVARADPDGYAILLSTSAFSINPGLYETPPYDPFNDFTAVCELAVSPHVFAVKPELAVKTMKEFVALAKADPDKFNVSVKALISGTVQLSSGVLAPAHPQIKAGTIKGLAVTGRSRWHDLPEIPTMLEAGYPDFVFETYTALMAPAKTPPEIVGQLEKSALAVLAKPDMREKLTQAGFEVTARNGKGHAERIAKEVPMYRDIIAQAGIKKL